jgi:hypothetical protein
MPIKVIVTFLEEVENNTGKGLSLTDFSFAKSQKALEDYKGDFLIEERRCDAGINGTIATSKHSLPKSY